MNEKLLFCLSHITFSSLCAQAAGVTLINQYGKSSEACFYLGYLVVLERWKLKANGIKQIFKDETIRNMGAERSAGA